MAHPLAKGYTVTNNCNIGYRYEKDYENFLIIDQILIQH